MWVPQNNQIVVIENDEIKFIFDVSSTQCLHLSLSRIEKSSVTYLQQQQQSLKHYFINNQKSTGDRNAFYWTETDKNKSRFLLDLYYYYVSLLKEENFLIIVT